MIKFEVNITDATDDGIIADARLECKGTNATITQELGIMLWEIWKNDPKLVTNALDDLSKRIEKEQL